jgi:hypothetical protein
MTTKSKPARSYIKRTKTVCCICSKVFADGKRDCWCVWRWVLLGLFAADCLLLNAAIAVLALR